MSWCKRLGERVNKCFGKILFHAEQLPLKQKKIVYLFVLAPLQLRTLGRAWCKSIKMKSITIELKAERAAANSHVNVNTL